MVIQLTFDTDEVDAALQFHVGGVETHLGKCSPELTLAHVAAVTVPVEVGQETYVHEKKHESV